MDVSSRIKELDQQINDSVPIMGVDIFWSIIDQTIEESKGDYEKQQEKLTSILLTKTELDILKFEARFNYYIILAETWDLWEAIYVIEGGCSDDGFDYFRQWLIAQGKDKFLKAVGDPESLASFMEPGAEIDFEGMGYAAAEAYEQVVGKELPYDLLNLGITDGIVGTQFDEDNAGDKFPKLKEKFAK